MAGTIALRFDRPYQSVHTVGRSILSANGLVGTLIVSGTQIGGSVGGSPVMTKANIDDFVSDGFEIGSYLYDIGGDLTALSEYDARQRLWLSMESVRQAGYNPITGGATGRNWDSNLASYSLDYMRYATALKTTDTMQSYPIPDYSWIANGGSASLNSVTMTLNDMKGYVDTCISEDALYIPIIHQINEGGTASVSTADFTGLMEYIAAKVALGDLRAVTISEAMADAPSSFSAIDSFCL